MSLRTLLINLFILSLSFILFSCASDKSTSYKLTAKNDLFSYQDASGNFLLKRQTKIEKGKIISRSLLFSDNNSRLPLEKIISVSKLGTLKNKRAILPEISQYTVWFDKKEYFAQHKVDQKNRSLVSSLTSPEARWSGHKLNKFPAHNIFCFFSQLPECMGYFNLLKLDLNKSYSFTIILESYPFSSDQYTKLPASIFIPARVGYDGEFEGNYRFSVTISNQVLSYHFNKKMEFEKMFWMDQSISMVKQN